MKRYFFSTFSFFFLLLFSLYFFYFQYPPPAEAIGSRPEGYRCSTSAWRDAEECAQGLICDPNLDADTAPGETIQTSFGQLGVCVRPPSKQCTCTNPGVAEDGKNGFTCEGGPEVFCDSSSYACYPAGEDEVVPGRDIDGGEEKYPGTFLKGVRCEEPRTKAICNCVGTGTSGANNFECYKEGESSTQKTATGYCKNEKAKCVNTDPSKVINSDTVWKFTGFIEEESSIISGIKCDAPTQDRVYPTLPPPPPPPCAQPIGPDGNCAQFATAVGLLGTVPEQFISNLFAVLLSISGGIALLLIIKAGYQMMTSQGKPESINNARDQLVAAIVGLIFLILSFVILQVIGFDILQIPGFGA